MKHISLITLTLAAALLAACGAPAGNAPAHNADTDAAKPIAAAPTADALLALDKQANEAYFKADARFFEGKLSDKFVTLGPGGSRMDKAETTKMIAGVKCDIKDGWKIDEPHVTTIDADTYVLSYKGTFDGTCTTDGKTEKAPSPIRAATVWVRSGDRWLAAFHGENLIVDPKAPAAPPAKPEAKKEEPKKDDKAASNANTAAAPVRATPDANTDALVKVELALWEAWKAHDAKELDELMAKDVSFVNIFGTYFATKADAMKDWTGANCEIKSVSVTDGFASALSPTVEMLTRKGTADGTCGGQEVGGTVIWGVSIYVKDGDAWKFAFGMNSPA
jgi:ketosteroid isomerase-like protein